VPNWAAKRQNVKSESDRAADGHERAKDFLSAGEMEALLDAMKAGRHGVRNHLLALMMYRHGLRVSEAVDLRRDEVDFDQARLWVRRLKNGLSVEQPIAGDELRAIKRYLGSRSDARTRSAADATIRELPHGHRCDPCRPSAGPAAHVAPFVRLLSRQQGLRSASHPGLSGSS